jgi:ParB-like chromosome segregation protein Spo0J
MVRRADIEKNANALEQLVVEYVGVTDVKPNEYNPNRQSDHEFELLCRSMREDGFTQPIVVQRATMEVVDGEHRWRAAQALGMTEVPVVYVDMTAEQMRIATLRHNRARGSEDLDRVGAVFRDLEKLGVLDQVQDSLMLDDVELDRILQDVPDPESTAGLDAELDAQLAAYDGQGRDRVDFEGAQLEGATSDAVEAQRRRERLMAKARTDEQRQRVAQEAASMHRLMLLFEGEEGQFVKATLAPKPAEALVAACRWYEENVS